MIGMNSRTVGQFTVSNWFATLQHWEIRTAKDQAPHSPTLEAAHDGERERAEDRSSVDSRGQGNEASELVAKVGAHSTGQGEEH